MEPSMSKYDSSGDSFDDYPWRDEAWLRKQYCILGRSPREIGERFDGHKDTIHRWLKRHGIGADERPWRDEDRLRELYHGQSMGLDDVASEVNASVPTVLKWMDEYGIERRSAGEYQTPEKLKDAGWLRERYDEAGGWTKKIADELGCSPGTVRRALDRHGIERQNPRELSHRAKRVLPHKTRLRQLYVVEKRSRPDIGELLGCAQQTVGRWLSHHGIESRSAVELSRERTGEDHPNWTGGYETYYGADWKQQRVKALKRDGDVCQRCGLTATEHREKTGKTLDVHHIRPSDAFDSHEEANRLDNLITLCRGCHIALEGLPIDSR